MPEQYKDFLGQGFGFPLRLEQGELAPAREEENIRQALYVLLMTRQGERLLRPDFGSRIWEYVFELPGRTTEQLLCDSIRQTVLRWEHRVDEVAVAVDTSQLAQGRLELSISYRVRATNHPDNLTFPFYLEEGRW